MSGTSKTAYYGNFIGLDASSDPKAVARNRLAYAINMWRDYESEQGAAVETFPGFRRVAHSLGLDADGGQVGAVHGLYHFRSRRGIDYVVVHAGKRLYAFENEALASGDYGEISNRSAIIKEGVADNDSTAFIFNNNLYILDGTHYLAVSDVGEEKPEIRASAVDAYKPTTYYNGNLYEQRNMLLNEALQIETGAGQEVDAEEPEVGADDVFYAYEEPDEIYDENDGMYYPGYYAEFYGFKSGCSWVWQNAPAASFVYVNYDKPRVRIAPMSGPKKNIKRAYIYAGTDDVQGFVDIESGAFYECTNLEEVYIVNRSSTYDLVVNIESGAFNLCPIKKLYFVTYPTNTAGFIRHVETGALPDGVEPEEITTEDDLFYKKYINLDPFGGEAYSVRYPVYERVTHVKNVTVEGLDGIDYIVEYNEHDTEGFDTVAEYWGSNEITVKAIRLRPCDVTWEDGSPKRVEIDLELMDLKFTTVAGINDFQDGNPSYKSTTIDAINGCTKSAVYDGRVFLTGNVELPNTVFYSQRNLTGANDPAYFGVYNYFNDGVGNTPNVDVLSTPSFLMVIKKDTVQDGSVYYHVGTDNTDENFMNILPRIYPSTSGAAGIGSAAGTAPSRLSCNFLDDPVFISKRGLEAVGKEQVNLERTVQHRSSNIDRLLIKEKLTRASLAEWKGYLVICCEGHMYLADSRYMNLHADGSYQYEWYYLEGLGTYEGYKPRWVFWMDFWPLIDPEGIEAYTLGDFLTLDGQTVREVYRLHEREDLSPDAEIHEVLAVHPEDDSFTVPLYYAIEDDVKYLVGWESEEQIGLGRFFGATKILTVGERLLFGTDNGDVCIINTDMRGVSVGEREIEPDRIDRSFYTFGGVAYLSGCSMRLDDCDAKGVVKNTECGTTAIRFKMMPGSRARINVTLNGRDWHTLGEAYNSRFDFTDLQFSNFSFGENENNVVVIPELTRGWVQKQYYVYNDRFEEPFGLYELSFAYYVYGKIHY